MCSRSITVYRGGIVRFVGVFTLILLISVGNESKADGLSVSTHDLSVLVGGSSSFDLIVRESYDESVTVRFFAEHDGLIQIDPSEIVIPASDGTEWTDYNIRILGHSPGHLVVTANSTVAQTNGIYVRVTVQHSEIIATFSVVVGWIYFAAWSISFYPQIYINFDRKSVVGLNFDFVGLNVVGFMLYSIFNVGLFFIIEIEQEYFNRYPKGLNPVQINDVVFSLHAVLATMFVIGQCIMYERGGQTVSKVGYFLISLCLIIFVVTIGLASGSVVHWLDFLYICSYIKLGITLVKYVPQAYMNYKRKSTVGWSIGNIFLDFTGGILSMLQMMLNAYNYDDWVSLFGDPTKFGLGLFSVMFDIFFIIQHYVLYRDADKKIVQINKA